jgi:hypothetical protein
MLDEEIVEFVRSEMMIFCQFYFLLSLKVNHSNKISFKSGGVEL